MNNLTEVIQAILRRSLEIFKSDGAKVFDVDVMQLDGHMKAAVNYTNGTTQSFVIVDDQPYTPERHAELESSLFGAASLAIGISNSLRQTQEAA